MANVILTPKLLTRLTLMNLGGYLNVARNMSKDYSREFGQKARKIGDSFDVRKPQRFTVSHQVAYDPNPLTNTKTTIKVDGFSQVSFECDSIGLTLDIQDIQERYAKPAAIALAHDINAQAAKYAALNTFNSVGLPGTVPGTDSTAVSDAVKVYLNAGDKLVGLGLPEGEDLALIMNRKMSSQFVVATKTLFNPVGKIGGQLDQGEMADRTLGYRVYKDQTLYTRQVGPLGGSPTTSGAADANSADGGNNGTMSLNTKGWTAAASSRLKQGDRFTIDTVYSVHPQTRQSTGDLQQFVVLEDFSSAADGTGAVKVAPAITPSGQYQNVTNGPADGATITVVGSASASTVQGLLMHKNAYAFMSVPLENPPDGKGVVSVVEETDPDTGLRISYIEFFDGKSRVHGHRFDALYGFGTLYREMACVIEA